MRVLTAVVQAGLVGVVVYVAIRMLQDVLENRQFWQEVRSWVESHTAERG